MRNVAPLFLLLTAGCPETLQQSCPQGTALVGAFQIEFKAQDDAGDFCRVVLTADGGPADGSVAPAPQPQPATLCSAPTDGGLLYMAITGQRLRSSQLDDAGAFAFPGQALNVAGTQCNCPVDINESFTGTLQDKAGGPAVFGADGTLPPVGAINASLVDGITASAPLLPDGGSDGGTSGGCRCNLPCALRYDVAGKPL